MRAQLHAIRKAIRRNWPHAWTASGSNERLDAPAGSPNAWRPWWSSIRRGQRK